MQDGDIVVNSKCTNRNTAFENRAIPYRSPLGHVSCITSDYGIRRTINGRTSIHYGIDLRAAIGTPIYAPAFGIITDVYYNKSHCGNGITINHANGYSTTYCHLSQVFVTHGNQVFAGCLIGKTGNSGTTTGPHLHYMVKKDGESVNPKHFLEPGHKKCP